MWCLHCKFFARWTGGCADVNLFMYAQTNEHHLHSCVLLFLCLDYLLHPACGDMSSLILARDDGHGSTARLCHLPAMLALRVSEHEYDVFVR